MTLEIIGLIGALAFLVGFIEVSIGKWDGQSRRFETLNLIGAIFLGYYALQKHAYMNAILSVIWAIVAVYTIFHVVKRHKVRKVNRAKVKRSRVRTKSPRTA